MTYPTQKSGPGAAGIVIGIALIVIGVLGGIALVVTGARSTLHTVNSYKRVGATSGGAVTFSETGRWYAFYERPGIQNRSDVPPVRIELSGPGDPQVLFMDSTSTTEHYAFNGHEGVRITGFNITRTGQYRVRVLGESVVSPVDKIAFGRSSITKGLLGAVGGFLGGGFVAFIGLIVLITTIVRRGRHRKRMAYAAYGGGFGPPGFGPPGGQGPAWPPPGQTGPPPWAPPAGQPAQPNQPGQFGGWAPPSQPPGGFPPPSPPPPSGTPGPGDDPGRAGWGGPGQ